MSKLLECGCGRPAIEIESSSGRCAVCKAIEDRMPSDYHPNCPPKPRELYDLVWSASTQRMVARGFADWCVREHRAALILNP